MGNHEYCEICGENDFHRHRPCDPEKVAKMQKAEQDRIARRKRGTAIMRAKLDAAGIPYRMENESTAIVYGWDFSE